MSDPTKQPLPDDETYLTDEEVVARYNGNLTTRTLANWRSLKSGGPDYVKLGGKVLYPLSRLIAWETDRIQKG